MKFVADAMLGKLARRLRLRGFDVLYDPRSDDNEIIRRSLEEQRTILTRDAGLASRPLARTSIIIESDHVHEQEVQVLESVPPESTPCPMTRCSVCNSVLRSVGRNEVRDEVPSHVLHHCRDFSRCDGCGRVYWRGSHVRRMEKS